MVYNISYDIAAILIMLVLIGGMNTVLYTDTYGFRLVRRYVYCVLASAVLDVITAVTISYGQYIPDMLNQFLNTLYQYASALALYSAMHIVFNYYPSIDKVNTLINKALRYVFALYLAVNFFTGIAFYFDNGKYCHGPAFVMTYILSLILIVHAMIMVFMYRSDNPGAISNIVLFSLLMPIIFAITQMVVGDTLISTFGAALAGFIMMFALETPDYKKLMRTMKELESAKEEANIANHAKSDFLASMSHEIRTPINGILGMDTMILRDSNDPQVTEYAENIRISGNILLSIINDILDLSKIESGRMELIPASYDLFSILNDCYQMNRMRASENGLEFSITSDPDMPSGYFGDEVRIRQILNNLISNGLKYTKEGFVRVTVSCDEPLESERIGDEGEFVTVVVSVADSGIGIKEEDRDRLFESFTRLDEGRNRNIEGTGLGLRITSLLVGLMKGSINVESTYREGSVFTVRIPQKVTNHKRMGIFEERLKERVLQAKNKTSIIKLPGKKALIIDDVKMNILVFKGLLRETEMEIDSACSGPEGIRMTREKKYDIIFMDHLMPQMDGIEAFHAIKDDRDNMNCDTPVVVLTANAISGVRSGYMQEGFDDYLTKPVEQEALLSCLREYLS